MEEASIVKASLAYIDTALFVILVVFIGIEAYWTWQDRKQRTA